MNDETSNTRAKRHRRMAREPQLQETSPPDAGQDAPKELGPSSVTVSGDKPPSKTSLILDLLARAEGATLDQMVEATGWLPHTTRAALTGLKKKGHAVSSVKADGVRVYRLVQAAAL
ncbi:DUF3489 domain-containing protein [Tsuneonella sp. HG094]